MTGNVRMVFTCTERYWKEEVYNLLCTLLMNRTKNNRTYILGQFTLGEKIANVREGDSLGQPGW